MDAAHPHAVLLLNIPPSSLCGIDLLSFTTSPRFQGIRQVPSGWHFIYTSSTTSLSVRHGVWVHLERPNPGPPLLLIKKWDAEKEELVAEDNETERLRWMADLDKIWHDRLTPYRQSVGGEIGDSGKENLSEVKRDWEMMTDCLSPTLLSRVTGGDANNWTLTSVSSAKQDVDDIPGLQSEVVGRHGEKELHFLPINLKQTWRSGAIGRERTEAARDRSWALGDIIENHCAAGHEDELLGEMQFTFLVTLTLANYSCMEQWKRILNLVFTCQAAIPQRPTFFVRVLRLLRMQLQHCNDVEGGLFDLTDQGGAILKQLMKTFARALNDDDDDHLSSLSSSSAAVKEEYTTLASYVTTELGWQLNDDAYLRSGLLQLEDGEQVDMDLVDELDFQAQDERGEYAPVVVVVDD